MEVSIKFDTNKESVEDLQKLVHSLQQLIEQRQQQPQMRPSVQPMQIQPPVQQQAQKPASGHTSGGGRVIPYEDIGDTFSRIFSGKSV